MITAPIDPPKESLEMDSTSSNLTNNLPFSATDYHQSKVVVERILGGLLLMIAAPVIGLIVVVVRITSSGKGIYKQTRVGKQGREFPIYKIRTMYKDAEACGTPKWSTPGDSRITPVGGVLRFLHLDELPQLINVALGHMSLIGPRPERPAFVTRLAKTVPNYLERLAVLPGVTGLAQINLSADDSLESVRQKVVLDREYIQTATLGQDLRIFFCTLFRMTGLCHGVAPRLFGLERDPNALLLPESNCNDTVELAGALDDTMINRPSLIAASAASKTTAFDPRNEPVQVACLAKTGPNTNPSEIASETTSPSPRRPR